MRDARFQRLTEAFGARIERWPTAEREAGERAARLSPDARDTLEAARALDDALDLAAPRVTDADVERLLARVSARIDEIGRVPPAPIGFWTRFRPHVPTAGFLTAMWLAGVIVGNVGWSGSSTASVSLDGLIASGYERTAYLTVLSE